MTRMDNNELVSLLEFAMTNSQERKMLEKEIALIKGYVDSCKGKEVIEQREQRHKSHLFTMVNNDCKIATSEGKHHSGEYKDDNNSKVHGENGANGYHTAEGRGPQAQVAKLQANNYIMSIDIVRQKTRKSGKELNLVDYAYTASYVTSYGCDSDRPIGKDAKDTRDGNYGSLDECLNVHLPYT